jgi:hypothetical protein
MAELNARWKPGQEVPGFCTAQVNAGRFVKVTGVKTAQGDYPVTHCGAGQKAFGVAQYDSAPSTQPATDQERRVNIARGSTIARVVAGAAVDASSGPVAVKSDANGKAVAATTGTVINGYALTSATAADQVIEVELTLAGVVSA